MQSQYCVVLGRQQSVTQLTAGALLPHTSIHTLECSGQQCLEEVRDFEQNSLGPSLTAPIATTITATITAPVAAAVTASIAAPVATSIAAAVTESIAKPVKETPAFPEIGQAVPDPFLGRIRLATPLELAGHECFVVGSAVIAMTFWHSIALDSVGLVSRCHRRDGLRLCGCWRQELDRVIARNSGDNAERSGRHCCT